MENENKIFDIKKFGHPKRVYITGAAYGDSLKRADIAGLASSN